MIIIKTSNGDVFVNDKETQVVQHYKTDKCAVIRSHKDGPNCVIQNVEGIMYTNEAQPTEWKDEGSEVERLARACDERGDTIKKWCKIYKNIKDDFFHFIVEMIRDVEYYREQLPADVRKAINDRAEELRLKVLHDEYVNNIMRNNEPKHELS